MAVVITLDGPAGAGKSTVSRALARRLSCLYLDTGAMYRALTVKALDRGISMDDPRAIGELAARTEIRLVPDPDAMRVTVDGEDVTERIRNPEVSRNVSYVARVPEVRAEMVRVQRKLGEGGSVVAEGRDMGTVVFPHADLKVYLEASPHERARRRASDLALAGHAVDLEALEAEIRQRDHLDATRDVAPMAAAADAIRLVTDDLSADQVVDRILDLLQGGALAGRTAG